MIKIIYTTDASRAEVIASMTEKILIEDAICADEKFLLFVGPDEMEPYVLEIPPPGPARMITWST